jgi:hypothetical protein
MCHLCAWSLNTQVVYVHINRIDRMQRKFVRYVLRRLGWTDMHGLPPYVDRFALFRFETLTRIRSVA